MLFGKTLKESKQKLEPFVFRLESGFLVGLAAPASQGSPCSNCVLNWLQDRNVFAQRAQVSDLQIRRDILEDLLAQPSAHIFYEIAYDGTVTRLENIVFPHPRCECDKTHFNFPISQAGKYGFAFSPIQQLKCVRYTTPQGDWWLCSATGLAPESEALVSVVGTGTDKNSARLAAVDLWLKEAALRDLDVRTNRRENILTEELQSGKQSLLDLVQSSDYTNSALGAGANVQAATLDALQNLVLARTIKRYSESMKQPMLIVGTNTWVRNHLPFVMLQQYDVYLFFYPNSSLTWIVGAAAFSRKTCQIKPIFVFNASANIYLAMTGVLGKLVATCRPDPQDSEQSQETEVDRKSVQRNLWWTNWVYRCPKISLKDVLQLEPYAESLGPWREYFRDGQPRISVVVLNSAQIPQQVRALVQVREHASQTIRGPRPRGIGTWEDFRTNL